MIRFMLLATLLACSPTPKAKHVERTQVDPSEVDHGATDTASEDDTGNTPPATPDPCAGVDETDDSFEPPSSCPAGRCSVPEGPFKMGSFSGYRDECPAREVTVDAFDIDQTEVTWAQYETCVAEGECEAPPTYCRDWAETLGGADPRPVTCVTWPQADAYCRSVGGRLPTEAEWEKAARGPSGNTWPWGSFPPNCEMTNYRFVAWYCEPGTARVGQYFNESRYGAQDMAGNAWEWVGDHYDAEWYRGTELVNPTGPVEECRPAEGAPAEPCVDRVVRGGAYNSTAMNIRGAARSSAEPLRVDKNIGFRCAYSP